MTAEADLVRLGEAVEKARAAQKAGLFRWLEPTWTVERYEQHSVALALLAHVGDERMVLARDAVGRGNGWTEMHDSFEDLVERFPMCDVREVAVRRTRIGEGE